MNDDELELALAISLSETPNDTIHVDISDSDYELALRLQNEESDHPDPKSHSFRSSVKENPVEVTNALLEKEHAKRGIRKKIVPTITKITCVILAQDADLSEHKSRLHHRLKDLGLVELKMPSDGNCQFSSVSDQLLGTWREHRTIRENAVRQIIGFQDMYKQFIPYDFDRYCTVMGNTAWGDNITVQAIADYYGIEINLITSLQDSILVQVFPREKKSSKVLWLSYINGVHYNSLYTLEEWKEIKKSKQKDCIIS